MACWVVACSSSRVVAELVCSASYTEFAHWLGFSLIVALLFLPCAGLRAPALALGAAFGLAAGLDLLSFCAGPTCRSLASSNSFDHAIEHPSHLNCFSSRLDWWMSATHVQWGFLVSQGQRKNARPLELRRTCSLFSRVGVLCLPELPLPTRVRGARARGWRLAELARGARGAMIRI